MLDRAQAGLAPRRARRYVYAVVGGRASTLELRLLGAVEAVEDGRALPLGGPRIRALLALLLLEPGRTLTAERLVDELWAGRPPRAAGTTLRSYVSRLRKTLGHDAVVAAAGGYAIVAERTRVDARLFEELAREGRDALRSGAAGRAADRLGAALALWRGPALTGVCESDALAAEARRLEELRFECVEQRLEADLLLGRHAELVPELQALVRDEPLRERLWRHLVLALYRSGRQADALAAYREARGLLDSELGLEPGAELRELERAILRQEVAVVPAVETWHNLPAATTSFVGRETEVADVARLLRTNRLVTLTGMGGSGKTRLALETAWRQTGAWRDGIWLADLTAVADGDLVPGAVAATVEAVVGPAGRGDELCERLRPLELLLVVDNCEHLTGPCAELVEALLRACPNVRVLATSRIPLAVAGELEYAVDPLGPEPAVQLFLERAAAVRRDLAADARSLPTIGAICRELDGLPLAIELAAARAKALSPAEIAARLDDRFRFLRAWKRVADPRHRTLQTAMDWSYGLLAPDEQRLLRALAVFAGGADLAAVAAVCLDGREDDAVELLGRLVDASLVVTEAGERTRYRLLETVRQYAVGKLPHDDRREELRRRHAEHYLEVAESANLSIESLGRGEQRQEIALREQHNLRAALDWAETNDVELGLRLMLALENFWIGQQAMAEGARRYERLLARADHLDPGLRAGATRDYAACFDVVGEVDRARELYARSGELAREAGDEIGMANATFRLGVVANCEGRIDLAHRLYAESLEEYRRLGYRVGEIQGLGNLGWLEIQNGDSERGREMLASSLAIARRLGWHWWVARGVSDLAQAALAEGRYDEVEKQAREFLELAWRISNRQETLFALAMLARAAAVRGDDERALALWSTVDATPDAPGRFGAFDREAFAAAMPDGPLPPPLPLADAVALALALT